MQVSPRKYLTVVVLLLVTLACLVYIEAGRARNTALQAGLDFSKLPLEIGQWQGRDIALSEKVYEILETRDVLMREYVRPGGESVVLAIVHSGSDRSAFHPPELCYLGGGVELLDKSVEALELSDSFRLVANKLVMKAGDRFEVAWYWFSAGDEFTHNYYIQQYRFILNELLRRGESSGALIRVSTSVTDGDLPAADARVKEMIENIAKFL